MSRSYKKNAIVTQGQDSAGVKKKAKRLANKRVRRQDVSDGNSYKRVSDSWDICDWRMPDSSIKGRRK